MKAPTSLVFLLCSLAVSALAGEPFTPVQKPAPADSSKAVPGAKLSPWTAEVAKLAEAGLDDSILQTFIDSAGTFNLNSDQIIYLRDVGLAPEAINAMLQHDLELSTGMRQMSPAAVPPSPPSLEVQLVPKTTPGNSAHVDAPAKPQMVAGSTSIINQLPELNGPGIAVPVAPEPDWFWPPEPAAPTQGAVAPVRQPYPVALTDPIVVFRASTRPANVVLLEPIP